MCRVAPVIIPQEESPPPLQLRAWKDGVEIECPAWRCTICAEINKIRVALPSSNRHIRAHVGQMKLGINQILAVALVAAFVAGCRQDKITFTDVPKERAERSAEPIAVQVPTGWEQAPRGEFRVHSFIVRGASNAQAEISVIPLPNLGGRLLDNINRWRSSVGLQALSEEEIAKEAKPVKVSHETGSFFEMAGDSTEKDEPTRILGAIVNIEGNGWYFKMMGDDKLVSAQKPEFMKFLAAYQFPPHSHDDHAGHNHAEDPHAGVAAEDPHAGLNIAAAPPTPESGPPQKAWPAPPS
ncbi:MAG TPA: hypothetical protein VK530_19685, partial [Candidatus Acidoferrum sp.]|nr:hypothetical protein [Candidatus Acidoferrum sp.]